MRRMAAGSVGCELVLDGPEQGQAVGDAELPRCRGWVLPSWHCARGHASRSARSTDDHEVGARLGAHIARDCSVVLGCARSCSRLTCKDQQAAGRGSGGDSPYKRAVTGSKSVSRLSGRGRRLEFRRGPVRLLFVGFKARRPWLTAAIIMIAAGAVALALLVWRSPHRGDLEAFGSFIVAVAVPTVSLVVYLARIGRSGDLAQGRRSVDDMANLLADAVKEQWTRAAADRWLL
jgi:hypothetical protein